jgi:hypothetical protein
MFPGRCEFLQELQGVFDRENPDCEAAFIKYACSCWGMECMLWASS